MKLDPINIILSKEFNYNKRFYFISGNEVSLIERVCDSIIEKYQKKETHIKSKLDSLDNFKNEDTLFGSRNIYIGRNCKGLKEENISRLRQGKDIFIFIQENSQKSKAIKDFFNKKEDSYVIECYELNRTSKIKILNEFLETKNIKLPEQIYWYLIDRLDNRYAFFENILKKILDIDPSSITLENIKKLVSPEESINENLFFQIFKKNSEIIKIYKDKIVSSTEVNELYYSCKYFCQLMIDCENIEDYNKKIPRYLFKEKNFLVEFYKKYNSKKKRRILNLLSNMEKILRKDTNLSVAYGLRFILKIKKITIS